MLNILNIRHTKQHLFTYRVVKEFYLGLKQDLKQWHNLKFEWIYGDTYISSIYYEGHNQVKFNRPYKGIWQNDKGREGWDHLVE